MDGTKLDGAFIELSLKGLREVLSDLRTYKDDVIRVREELDLLKQANANSGFDRLRNEMTQTASSVASLRREVAALNDELGRVPRDVSIRFRSDLSLYRPPLPTAERIPTGRLLSNSPQLARPKLDRAQVVIPVRVVNVGQIASAVAAAFGHGKADVSRRLKTSGHKSPWAEAGHAVAGANMAAFAAGSAGIMGFVRAGLAGSVEAQMLGVRMQWLSREIAGIFLPVINRVIDAVGRLTQWFRSLSGTQQDQIMKWSLLGLGVTGFLGVAPKLMSGMSGLATTAAGLAEALGMSAAAAGPVGIAIAVIAAGAIILAARFAYLFVSSEKFRANVAKIVRVMTAVWNTAVRLYETFEMFLKPVLAVVSPFAFILIYMEEIVDLIAKGSMLFVVGWNKAIEIVSNNMERFAAMMKVVALATGNIFGFLLWRMAQNRAGELKDLLGKAKLELPKDGKGGHRLPTPYAVGNEDAKATFDRYQQAAYRELSKEKDEKAILKDINAGIAPINAAAVLWLQKNGGPQARAIANPGAGG